MIYDEPGLKSPIYFGKVSIFVSDNLIDIRSGSFHFHRLTRTAYRYSFTEVDVAGKKFTVPKILSDGSTRKTEDTVMFDNTRLIMNEANLGFYDEMMKEAEAKYGTKSKNPTKPRIRW